MKVLVSSAALLMGLQFAICGLEASASVPVSEGVRHEQEHGEPPDTHAANPHRHAGDHHHKGDEPGASGEDHCDLVGRSLTSASPALAAPSLVTLLTSNDLQGIRELKAVRSFQSLLRAPPKPPDLILQKSSFLL